MSDSRYLTSDPFVLCMETVTAVGLWIFRDMSFLPTILTLFLTDLLGSFIFCCGPINYQSTSPSSSAPSIGVPGPALW